MKVVAVMVLHMILVLQQVMLQVLNKVDNRRRSLPMVLVHLVETAPSSPQSLCSQNVTAKAGMTARLFCCLAVNNKGAEARLLICMNLLFLLNSCRHMRVMF